MSYPENSSKCPDTGKVTIPTQMLGQNNSVDTQEMTRESECVELRYIRMKSILLVKLNKENPLFSKVGNTGKKVPETSVSYSHLLYKMHIYVTMLLYIQIITEHGFSHL
jgi:hypothetical protein